MSNIIIGSGQSAVVYENDEVQIMVENLGMGWHTFNSFFRPHRVFKVRVSAKFKTDKTLYNRVRHVPIPIAPPEISHPEGTKLQRARAWLWARDTYVEGYSKRLCKFPGTAVWEGVVQAKGDSQEVQVGVTVLAGEHVRGPKCMGLVKGFTFSVSSDATLTP